MADDLVTLPCGCTTKMVAEGVKMTPVCAEHRANPTALGLLAAGTPVVRRLAAEAVVRAQTPTPAFSYSGDPRTSLRDAMRFRLQDTNAKSPAFTDGELDALLEQADGDVLSALIMACDIYAAKFAGALDESVGSVSISFSRQAAGYAALLQVFRRQLAKRALPYAGGISISDKLARRSDGDRVRPSFARDMMQVADNGEALGPDLSFVMGYGAVFVDG